MTFWTLHYRYWEDQYSSIIGVAAKDKDGRTASCYLNGDANNRAENSFFSETRDLVLNAKVGVRYDVTIAADGSCNGFTSSVTGIK